jgi:hypothetical protein
MLTRVEHLERMYKSKVEDPDSPSARPGGNGGPVRMAYG